MVVHARIVDFIGFVYARGGRGLGEGLEVLDEVGASVNGAKNQASERRNGCQGYQ